MIRAMIAVGLGIVVVVNRVVEMRKIDCVRNAVLFATKHKQSLGSGFFGVMAFIAVKHSEVYKKEKKTGLS